MPVVILVVILARGDNVVGRKTEKLIKKYHLYVMLYILRGEKKIKRKRKKRTNALRTEAITFQKEQLGKKLEISRLIVMKCTMQ